MMISNTTPPSLALAQRTPEIKTEEQALEFGREFFGQMMAKALYHAPESMDEDSTESPFAPVMKEEFGHMLSHSGAFDHEAWNLVRSIMGTHNTPPQTTGAA